MKKFSVAAAVAGALCLTPAALAADAPLYLNLALGKSDYALSERDMFAIMDSIDDSLSQPALDGEDGVIRLQLGYTVNDNVAVEFGFINLGEVAFDAVSDGSESGNGGFSEGPVSADLETTGINLGVAARFPVNETFGFYSRAGLFRWDAELDISNGGASGSIDDDGTDIYFGVGAELRMGRLASLQLELERYALDGDELPVIVDDVNTVTLGVKLLLD